MKRRRNDNDRDRIFVLLDCLQLSLLHLSMQHKKVVQLQYYVVTNYSCVSCSTKRKEDFCAVEQYSIFNQDIAILLTLFLTENSQRRSTAGFWSLSTLQQRPDAQCLKITQAVSFQSIARVKLAIQQCKHVHFANRSELQSFARDVVK